MKTIYITGYFFLLMSNFLFSQRYIYSTSNSSYGNYDLVHKNKITLGDDVYSQSHLSLQMFRNSNTANNSFLLGNSMGRIEFGVAGCSGCFSSVAASGDGVIRKVGQSHNLFFIMTNNNNDGNSKIGIGDGLGLSFSVFNNGKVTIGRGYYHDEDDYALYVGKGIKTEKVKVEIASENEWADYVFFDNYKLMPLKKLQSFIQENRHLPKIPTAKEVVEGGVELKELNIKLLEKIEELSLYVIGLEREIDNLKKDLNRIKDQKK